MHNKGKDEDKRQKEKMHLINELMGSADQVNLDGISESKNLDQDDDDDEVTMKKNRHKK